MLRWRATGAIYATSVYFQLAGDTNYVVNGHANFVVIEDKTKPQVNAPGKWLIYRWEDLNLGAAITLLARVGGAGSLGVEETSWAAMKSLYR